MWPPRDLGERAEIGVVVNVYGKIEGFLQPFENLDPHPFGQDGTLCHSPGTAVDGAGYASARANHRAAVHSAFEQ